MQRQFTTRARQGITLTLAPRIHTRRIRPGDRVLIYDALISQNIWIIVDDVLITGGRNLLRSGNMDFYFDDSLVIAHQRKGGRS
jgi:hypothetical protein